MKHFFTLFFAMTMLALTTQAGCYIVGNAPFGDWNPGAGVEMTQATDGTFTYTTVINGTVWFVFADGLDSNWDTFNANYRFGPSGNDVEVGVGEWIDAPRGGDKSYKFTGSNCEYQFIFNPHINKFKIVGDVTPIEIDTYTVAGVPASIFGTEWDPANADNDMVKQEDGTYALTKQACQLEGDELQFKVVGNRDWGFAWPDQNYVYTVETPGLYDVTITFDPETKEVGVNAVPAGEDIHRTGELYVIGQLKGTWDFSSGISISKGLKMETEDGNIFKATIVVRADPSGYYTSYYYGNFAFTTKLAANEDDWDGIKDYRIGATEPDCYIGSERMGTTLPLEGFGSENFFKILTGVYDVTVNLDEKTMVITQYGKPDVPEDVNNDGFVDLIDINAVVDMIQDVNTNLQGDVNADQEVNISDITAIIHAIFNNDVIDPAYREGHWLVQKNAAGELIYTPLYMGMNGNLVNVDDVLSPEFDGECPFYFLINGVAFGAPVDMTEAFLGDAGMNPLTPGRNCYYVGNGYSYTFGVHYTCDEDTYQFIGIEAYVAKGMPIGTTPQQ